MNKKYLLFPDNSFRESYCYYKEEKDFISVTERWNSVIDSIVLQLPDFKDKDFEFVDSPICMLETIGFGAFNHKLSDEAKKRLSECFPKPSSLLIPQQEFEEFVDAVIKKYLDSNLVKAFNNLFEFYKRELDPSAILIKLAGKKQQKIHSHVEGLQRELDKWERAIKLGKKGPAFLQLCRDLAWDAIVKRERWFIVDEDPKFGEIQESKDSYIRLYEKQIIKRLIAYYLDSIQKNDYLAGAVLFSKYAKLIETEKESSSLLRPYSLDRELLDPYLIEYACSGLYIDDELQQRKNVIIVTCEKIKEGWITDYIKAKKLINNDLEKIGFQKQNFVPGYIIIIDPQTDKIFKTIIDISKLI